MTEIPTRYNPQETEDKWYRFWEENNLFSAQPNSSKEPFCIVIPPPNVTGILHMGHALNNTIQDILIRYNRMQGKESLWMPGIDHAGIATQNVVEKALAKEGLKRQDLGREKFIEKVWQWKEEYGSTIIRQLKKLGSSCDWSRTRFTMDEEYSGAVVEAFIRLHELGLINRGNYIINWCPRCATALSDEEAPHSELQGNLYYLRYPLKEISNSKSQIPNYIVVATTRPETMLGDTAVAVNPKDKRYKHLVGKTLILPLVKREIKVIADSSVDMKFGTGAVKVTPAHDPNDFIIGKKHNLEFVKVMHPDGSMNELAGGYEGLDRFRAREVILEDLKDKDLLEKTEPHQLSAGHCYRCHTIIEPYLSKQWFVKMKPLSKPAIEAVKNGKIRFYPKRWTKVYLNWMENIQDWCISRQIWWGHRIPAWYCAKCNPQIEVFLDPKGGKLEEGRPIPKAHLDTSGIFADIEPIVSKEKPNCKNCLSKDYMVQDPDVLDTWFSSWLWPFATFYWPSVGQKSDDLNYFYPTSVLVTAPEIIFFWVARMIMAGFKFMGKEPFKDVYIHGTVRDIEGKKMSKSLGNIIDPLEIINEYGADALRFSLISITAQGQDVFLSKERFEQGRNFANKVWNASRFILLNLNRQVVRTDLCQFFKEEELDIVNRWILSRFYSVLKEVQCDLEAYKFNEAANLIYSFFWHEFCDWYLEIIKPKITDRHNQVIMYKVLEKSLRLMHPFMPFVSEEIWQMLQEPAEKKGESIMRQGWPHVQEGLIDKKAEEGLNSVFEIINAIRNMRSELEVAPHNTIEVRLFTSNKAKRLLFDSLKEHIISLSRLSKFTLEEDYTHKPGEFVSVLKDTHIAIPLQGVLDIDRHKKKIEERMGKVKAEIENKVLQLANENFLKRAPKDIIDKEKLKLEELKATLKKMEEVRDGFR